YIIFGQECRLYPLRCVGRLCIFPSTSRIMSNSKSQFIPIEIIQHFIFISFIKMSFVISERQQFFVFNSNFSLKTRQLIYFFFGKRKFIFRNLYFILNNSFYVVLIRVIGV